MSDYEDYENNLAFKPIGDWADTEPKFNTDRTQSSLDLVDKIEELNKWLDLKSEYIEKLEDENAKLKELLAECREYVAEWYADRKDVPFRTDKPRECVAKIDELLGEQK